MHSVNTVVRSHSALQVFLCLKEFRRGCGDAQRLDELQRQHQILFNKAYGCHASRPKHHLRMHLPAMYQSKPYRDCFACEKKMKDYKRSLSEDVGHRWKAQTGELSKTVLTRMINITIHQQRDTLLPKPKLHGKIYNEDEVEQFGGARARVSTRLKTTARILTAQDIIFWDDSKAAQICFFVEQNNEILVILTLLMPHPGDLLGTKRFAMTDAKEAIDLDKLHGLRSPSWWTIDGLNVLCLL